MRADDITIKVDIEMSDKLKIAQELIGILDKYPEIDKAVLLGRSCDKCLMCIGPSCRGMKGVEDEGV